MPGNPRAGMKIPNSKMDPGVHGRFTEGSRKGTMDLCATPGSGAVPNIFLICLLEFEFELWLVRKDLYIPEPGARNTELGTWGLGYGMLQACRPRTLGPGPG